MKILALALMLPCCGAHGALAPSAAVVRSAEDFSRVAELANPWVVNISTTQFIRQQLPPFWNEFFGENFQNGGREYRRQSLGSGIILSGNGTILTNSHVINGADEVKVRLENGEEYAATVLGEDENVDLAVLQIKPKRSLAAAVLGDSSKVRVGEWAIAIGNPFGFDHSVTVGVISAKERSNVLGQSGRGRYQNFIQTDASINHGNSGGPLCNIRGEVIGVNSAISTPNEGSIGIGFAIPINMVKRAVPDLIKSGHLVALNSARLGFYTQDIDALLAAKLNLGENRGVQVTEVILSGPADKAGLKRGDIIQGMNSQAISNIGDLKTRLYEVKPGDPIAITVVRQGKRIDLHLETQQNLPEKAEGWHGISVEESSPDKVGLQDLDLRKVLVVTRVAKGSSAAKIGLRPGDVILEVNRQPVGKLIEWKKMADQVDDKEDAVLLLVRGIQSAYVLLPAEK